jgi:hypothetical protein
MSAALRPRAYPEPTMNPRAYTVLIWRRVARMLTWRLAETADEAALPFVLAWVLCLIANPDLLETLAPLTAMGSRLPQLLWAVFGTAAAAVEIFGLWQRHCGRPHRRARIHGTLLMGAFFAWLAGELAMRDLGLPAVWYFAWLAFTCLLGLGRLIHLETIVAELEAERAARRP